MDCHTWHFSFPGGAGSASAFSVLGLHSLNPPKVEGVAPASAAYGAAQERVCKGTLLVFFRRGCA